MKVFTLIVFSILFLFNTSFAKSYEDKCYDLIESQCKKSSDKICDKYSDYPNYYTNDEFMDSVFLKEAETIFLDYPKESEVARQASGNPSYITVVEYLKLVIIDLLDSRCTD